MAYQHHLSHIGITYNHRADALASRAGYLATGELRFTLFSHPDVRRTVSWLQSCSLGDLPAADPAPPRPGTQTTCYRYWRARYWLTGIPGTVFAVRVKRWWGFPWSLKHVRDLFRRWDTPDRVQWTFYTALLGEWPTGRRQRHTTQQRWGLPCPVCRFCGGARDCVTHWFGGSPCQDLLLQVQRTEPIALPDSGILSLPLDDCRWPSIFRVLFAVHSLLRWHVEGSLVALDVREGIWLARSHATELQRAHMQEQQARKRAKQRQAKHRSKMRKQDLMGAYSTCQLCGEVYLTHHVICTALQAHRHGGDQQGGAVPATESSVRA